MHFEHSSPLLLYKANSKETIPRRESVVKNNELGEDSAHESRSAVKNDALGEVSRYETPFSDQFPTFLHVFIPSERMNGANRPASGIVHSPNTTILTTVARTKLRSSPKAGISTNARTADRHDV